MATQQWKYHVFISFRGEDTRLTFVCHLDKALRRTGLNTFVDNQLRRGEEISTVLLQAIQDSKVAVIIFSKNYASSSWCLDELLKITECHETHNQIVIPVFYHVDPSDVRKQNGSFEKSFEEHCKNPRYSNKIQKWKDALTKAANISGMGPDANREDNKLIDQIVKDVSEKLKHPSPRSLEGFVGLKSKISQVKTLLSTGSSDVRMLGIWGMGGIGKTTLAEAIFAQVWRQFEGRCFVRNVREAWEQGGERRLLKQLFSELLEQSDVRIDTTIIGPELFLVERLKNKRVFVVFDDVSDQSQLESLIGNQYCDFWFGAGSNIIITSRDKQVFEGITDTVYNVEALSYSESRQLFVRNAFKQKHPSQDHDPLLDSFVNYARGNPLAIKVLGKYVCGKRVKLWEEAWNKLLKCANEKIQDALKLSYEGLDREEKAIFLHIACFFKGENVNEAKRVFTSCGLSADAGVSRLVEKSLVTISTYDELDMHDLLQDMGREIVREESEDPRRRHHSRYWDKEILGVFEENEGTEAIEIQSIILNTSQIRDDMVLNPNVFRRMPNLKFLRFYTSDGERSKLHLTRGLRFLPSGLRYLYWDKYPLESLPTDFDAKELLVLHLPGNNIKQILKEVKDAGKLKAVAQFLIESPLISHVTNIASGILPFGIGNIKAPSSFCQFFSKITSLHMRYCQNLKSFPNNVDFQCLEILDLYGCSNLNIFPEISTNLRKLNVGGTAIKEVHSSSIEGLSRLQELYMRLCEKLESLPSNICKLKALQRLDLGDCSSLKKFPEILEPMYDLRTVDLSCSAIEAIPSSIDNMKGLEYLRMRNCLNLACFPESFGNFMTGIDDFGFSTACKQRKKPRIPSFRRRTVCGLLEKPSWVMEFQDVECLFFWISYGGYKAEVTIDRGHLKEVEMTSHVSECVSYLIDLPSHPCLRFASPCLSFFSLYYILDLSRCRIRELPKDLGSLYYLRELNLEHNDFVEIPARIKQLSQLESLRLDGCRKLRSLPQLPTSLCRLTALYCGSLKTLLAFKQPIFNGCKRNFYFNNSLKLEKKECEAMAYKMLRNGPEDVCLRYPGSSSPEWFRHQTTGDIIRIKLPSNWSVSRRFFGFAFCFVYNSRRTLTCNKYVKFECHFEDSYNPTIRFTYQTNFKLSKPYDLVTQQHVLVWCLRDFNVWISERRQLFGHHCMASFKFFIRGNKDDGIPPGCVPYRADDDDGDDDDEEEDDEDEYDDEIKKCGITPLYMRDDDDEDKYDDDENAYWMLQSSFLTEMSTTEDDEEDMNSGDAGGDADEVCSLTEKRKEKRKATVEAGSKIKRKREASA